ncbi:MAG: fatty acid desaturase [Pseudomonadota bacterium]
MLGFLETYWYGLWNPGLWPTVLFTLAVTHMTIVSVTVYLHRHSAHRSLDLHPALQHLFRFWLWLTTGMRTIDWTSVHRKHHAKCETEEDPHSPKVKGLWEIFWNGAHHYAEAATPENHKRYGRGCPDDWIERHLYTPRNFLGILLMFIIDVLLFGAWGITVWAVQMVWIPLFAAGVINGLGHAWGYRNYECTDAAKNLMPWGILIGGEELHNNHHSYPNSAKLSQKPWEFDIGWFWIRLFETFGLAKARSTGPIAERDPNKSAIDIDTLFGVLNDRLRVMARYTENVVRPAVRREYETADKAMRRVLRRGARVLTRDEILVDAAARERIAALTEQNESLRHLYEMRQRLQSIWAQRGGNSEELLQAFKQWCADAEASGVEALRDFVEHLKSYTVPAAVARA